jgi:hypothetical protein
VNDQQIADLRLVGAARGDALEGSKCEGNSKGERFDKAHRQFSRKPGLERLFTPGLSMAVKEVQVRRD